MEAQRWRLAMFASCGWFWEDPVRTETAGALRAAARAARLVDGLAGTALERGCSPTSRSSIGHDVDGADLGRRAGRGRARRRVALRESVSPRPARHGLTGESDGIAIVD